MGKSNKVNVCIIDNGVFIEKDNKLIYDLEININNQIQVYKDNRTSPNSHGTICSKIIKKYYSQVNLSSICICKESVFKANINQLQKALTFCKKIKFDVIHMSIGTTYNSDISKIIDCVNEINTHGTIIIAACNNSNIFSIPASLPCVIGVCTKRDIDGKYHEINKKSCDGIDYIASSRHLIDGKLTPSSNSYSAPYITAKVCQYLSENPKADTNEVREYLNSNAVNYLGEAVLDRSGLIHSNPAELDNWYGSVRKTRDIENPVVCSNFASVLQKPLFQ